MANKLVPIRRRSDFIELTKTGKRIQLAPWLVINFKKNELDHPRVGWTIPTSVGGAVLRNRLRRWCREIMRPEISKLGSYDINFFFRKRDSFDFYRIGIKDLDFRIRNGIKSLQRAE